MTGFRLLALCVLLISLMGCTVPPSPPGGPPVVDRSSLYRPPPPAPAPPVEVNPLPRSQPLQSQQFPPRQQVSTTTPPPSEPEDPFANRAVPQQSPPPTAAAEPPAPPAEQPAAELSQGSGPVVALLDNARSHVDNKDWDKAAASLERALRIEPRNATIWHDLAQIRLQQRDYQQAETLAQKSNSLAGSNRGVQARNWDLIAFSRRAQGNNSGADEAEAQATVLRR